MRLNAVSSSNPIESSQLSLPVRSQRPAGKGEEGAHFSGVNTIHEEVITIETPNDFAGALLVPIHSGTSIIFMDSEGKLRSGTVIDVLSETEFVIEPREMDWTKRLALSQANMAEAMKASRDVRRVARGEAVTEERRTKELDDTRDLFPIVAQVESPPETPSRKGRKGRSDKGVRRGPNKRTRVKASETTPLSS